MSIYSTLSQLNPAQREAVQHIKGPLLILAGAGTGKTRVITARIAYMIEEKIDPHHILSVTFTNKAANEMRERVSKVVPKNQTKHLTLCTFHSLCVRILRQSIEKLGYKSNFTIYTASDQQGLIKKIIKKKSGKDESLEPAAAISIISRARNDGQEIPQDDTLLSEVWRAYQKELHTLNAVDFDDLLVLALKVLEEFPEVRDYWQKQYRYFMVDEFQDTNHLQMRLLKALISQQHNICVVGDDDQSIYGWRGAQISNILEFERFFLNPKVVKLEQNYRSTTPILHTANSLIEKNAFRREKKLWSQNPGEDFVRFIAPPDAEEEADFIANEILSECNQGKLPWEDFAILFRTNAQSRLLEGHFRKRQIPYRIIGGRSFFDRREVKDILSYLNVLQNPQDDISLLRILNTPPRGIGAQTIRVATQHSVEKKQSVFESLGDPDFTSLLSQRAQSAIAQFLALITENGERLRYAHNDLPQQCQKLITEIEFEDYLKRICSTPEETQKRWQNVMELVESIHAYVARTRGEVSLQGFLEDVSLAGDKEQEKDLEDKTGVSLITMHAAKGLEFAHVFIVGIEEGILPHRRSLEENSLDEERRLFYVGITRAMQSLTLSCARSRMQWGQKHTCQPSRFLRELDTTYLDQVNYEALLNTPMEKETAQNSFAQMREMLSQAPETTL